MNALETPEVRKYRTIRAALGAVILLGLVAGLATIGAQAPKRDYVTFNCAYDPSATGTLTDAVPEIPDPCYRAAATPRRAAPHAVPSAASAVGTAPDDEVQPPTF